MSLRIIFPFIISMFLFQNCTVHSGHVISLDYGQAVSPLNKAKGEASVAYFWGFGGNKTTLLMEEAKDDLVMNRPLGDGESYVNVNLNISTTYIFFFTKSRFIITADVIPNLDYVKEMPSPIQSNLFVLGDTILSKRNKKLGTYNSMVDKTTVQIHLYNTAGDNKLIKKHVDNAFKSSGEYLGFGVGQDIKFEGSFPGSGKIIGLGENFVLVIEKNDDVSSVAYKDIRL